VTHKLAGVHGAAGRHVVGQLQTITPLDAVDVHAGLAGEKVARHRPVLAAITEVTVRRAVERLAAWNGRVNTSTVSARTTAASTQGINRCEPIMFKCCLSGEGTAAPSAPAPAAPAGAPAASPAAAPAAAASNATRRQVRNATTTPTTTIGMINKSAHLMQGP